MIMEPNVQIQLPEHSQRLQVERPTHDSLRCSMSDSKEEPQGKLDKDKSSVSEMSGVAVEELQESLSFANDSNDTRDPKLPKCNSMMNLSHSNFLPPRQVPSGRRFERRNSKVASMFDHPNTNPTMTDAPIHRKYERRNSAVASMLFLTGFPKGLDSEQSERVPRNFSEAESRCDSIEEMLRSLPTDSCASPSENMASTSGGRLGYSTSSVISKRMHPESTSTSSVRTSQKRRRSNSEPWGSPNLDVSSQVDNEEQEGSHTTL